MKRYSVKSGHKVLTKKRGMVTDYVTEADLDSKIMKDLLADGIIKDSSATDQKKEPAKKVKNESKASG